jgi:hypothetical protein
MKFRHPDIEYDHKGDPVVPPERKISNPTALKKIFTFLWETRPHVSFISGQPVRNIPTTFAHVLPKAKNRFPQFKLLPCNIVFLTPDEHHLWDNQRYKIEEDPTLLKKWSKMFKLESVLLFLHGEMFP